MVDINDLIISDVSQIKEIKYDIEERGYFMKKIIPINNESTIPMHKFWIFIDKCKLINKDDKKITIVMSSKSGAIEIINSIEKKIETQLKDMFCNSRIILSITNNFVPTISLNIDDDSVMFDNDDEILCVDEIKEKSDLIVITELDSLSLMGDKIFAYWKVIQLKETLFVNTTEPIFSKIQYKNKNQLSHVLPSVFVPQPPPPPPIMGSIPVTTQNSEKRCSFVPSIKDLSKALENLKKSERTVSSNTVDNIPKIQPILKHVETKEPKNILLILEEEHHEKIINKIEFDIKAFNNFIFLFRKNLMDKIKLFNCTI